MPHSPLSEFPPQDPVPVARERLAATRVLVIGDVMLDRYWFGDVSRISPEAPVPIVQVATREERLGGAANVARNIAALGAQVSLLGVVGDDDAGACVSRLLRQSGIGDFTCMRAGAQTIVKLRVLGQRQQLLRIDFECRREAAALEIDAMQLGSLMAAHDIVVLSDYAKGCLGDPQALITIARTQRCPVLVDPKGEDYSRYANANMVTPNLAELKLVLSRWKDEEDLHIRAQALRQSLSVPSLLLTRSAEGMTVFDDAGVRHFAAEAREVFDVSGAGDTVIAVLAALMGAGVRQDLAIALANRAAGIVVGKLGTATVDFDELFADRSTNLDVH